MSSLFVETTAPRRSQARGIRGARWLTWSPDFIDFVGSSPRFFARRTPVEAVAGCEPYAATYAYPLERLDDASRKRLAAFATSLLSFPARGHFWLFRDMLAPLPDRPMRPLFAALRSSLVATLGKPRAALYAPVNPARRDTGFDLHADLFLSPRLWLVFDDVPRDGSGASRFVPLREFLDEAGTVASLPRSRLRAISGLFQRKLRADSFDALFGFLHDAANPWYDDVQRILSRLAFSHSFAPGEGYLIDDRDWLHGRTPSSVPVSSRRFHRLTFGPERA